MTQQEVSKVLTTIEQNELRSRVRQLEDRNRFLERENERLGDAIAQLRIERSMRQRWATLGDFIASDADTIAARVP